MTLTDRRFSLNAFKVLFTLVWLAGCTGSMPSTPIGSNVTRSPNLRVRGPALGPDVQRLFLADASSLNLVTVLGRGPKTRSLTGFNEPQGLTADSSGNLYVANTAAENVEEFAPPYRNSPSSIIATPSQWPVDVAVSRRGVMAIIIICKAGDYRCGGPASVYFYADTNRQSPCAVVSGRGKISRLLWGAFDAAGTLYVVGEDEFKTNRIGAISGGCNATSLSVLRPDISIGFPEGVQVDKNGHIAVGDSHGFGNPPSIDVYDAPRAGSRRLKLVSEVPLNDSGVVSSFVLTKDGTELYTAEPHHSLEYAYPGGGYALGEESPPGGGDLIEGVAVTPEELP